MFVDIFIYFVKFGYISMHKELVIDVQ